MTMKRAIEEETTECIWEAPFMIELEMIKAKKYNMTRQVVKRIKYEEKYSEIVKKIEENEKEFQRIFEMYITCE